MTDDAAIDVIVPVHDALDDVVRCVESVRRCSAPGTYRLVLVDDASPDPRVGAYFAGLAREGDPALLLLRNPVNRGFPHTVNRGLQCSDTRDAIVLNSDAVVAPRWLEKLTRCARSDPLIGTVTPFSNHAAVASFPRFCQSTPLEALPEVDLIDLAIEDAATPEYPELPSAVGFCMLIRRSLIRAIGGFDAEAFGRGYGEDNDFSMRAAAAGFRNVLCDDTFVAHRGGGSFGESRAALMAANARRLALRHPGYAARVRAFVEGNPLRRTLAVAAARLHALATPAMGVLHVVHGDPGGGLRTHVDDLIRASASGAPRHYVLVAQGAQWSVEHAGGPYGTARLTLRRADGETWADVLRDAVRFLAIDLVHLHNLTGAREALVQALPELGVPFGVTLHEHYLACPTITLQKSDGEYCGAPVDARVCQQCLDGQRKYAGIDIGEWRRVHGGFLARAAFAIAPSASVAATLRRYFPHLRPRIVPHGVTTTELSAADSAANSPTPPPAQPAIVGVLGHVNRHKGALRLDGLVARTRERALPLKWIVVGYSDRHGEGGAWQSPDGILTFHGPYARRELGGLLDRYGIRLIVFPPGAPETFSLTLSEAWALGRVVLVPALGALEERVRDAGGGWIMEDGRSDDRILDQIMAILGPGRREEVDRMVERVRGFPEWPIGRMAASTFAVYADVARAMPRASPSRSARARMSAAVDSQAATVAAPPKSRFSLHELPPRNAACPCGSGRRYKHCCGALGDAGGGLSAPVDVVLAEALRRHHAGSVGSARGLYLRILAIDPANASAEHYLGMAEYQAGEFGGAEARIRRSIELNPSAPEFHNNLGLCLAAQMRHDAAVEAYRAALALDAQFAPAHSNLGLSLQELGEFGDAARCFGRALEIAPDYAEARWNLQVVSRLLE